MKNYLITVELISKAKGHTTWNYSNVVTCEKISTWDDINRVVRNAFNQSFSFLTYDEALEKDELKVLLLQEL